MSDPTTEPTPLSRDNLANRNQVETERLVDELAALGTYAGWSFSYEYPGFFCYSHPDHPLSIFFTPDWEGDELPIEVHDEAGGVSAEHSLLLPLPTEGRTGQKLFNLVRPTLDKLIAAVAGSENSDATQDLGREIAATIAYSAGVVLASHDVPQAAQLSAELGNNCAQSVILILEKHVETAQDSVRAMVAAHGWTAEIAIALVLEHLRQENTWQGALDDLVALIARRGEAKYLTAFLADCVMTSTDAEALP